MNDPALFHPALRHSCRIPLRSSRGAHLLHRSCVYEFHTTSVALVKKSGHGIFLSAMLERCWNDVGTMLGTMLERCSTSRLAKNRQLSDDKPCKEIGTPSLKAVGEKSFSFFRQEKKRKKNKEDFFILPPWHLSKKNSHGIFLPTMLERC